MRNDKTHHRCVSLALFIGMIQIVPLSLAAVSPGQASTTSQISSEAPIPVVQNYTTMEQAVEAYLAAGRLEQAEQLLVDQIASWDLLAHSTWIIQAQQKLVLVRGMLDQQQRAVTGYRGLEQSANRYIEAGNLKQAKRLLEERVKSWNPAKDIEQINKVNALLATIERQILLEDTVGQYLSELRKVVWVVFQVFVYFAAVFFIVVAIRWLRGKLRKRPGVGIKLIDQTVKEEHQVASSNGLSLMLGREIRAIEQEENFGIDVAGMCEVSGVETTLGEVAKLKESVAESPVKVGIVSFSPTQLFSYLASFFEPQHEYLLMGSYTEEGNDTFSLWVEKRKRGGNPVGEPGFHSKAKGSNARQRVVRDVAIQFSLANASSAVTSSWKSLREYLNAEELLSTSPAEAAPEVIYKETFSLLKQALRHDPSNWMARYSAATLLRRMGRYREATDQYGYLLRMMRSRDLAESSHFQAFLSKKPDFERTVRYRYAVSLAQSRDYLTRESGAIVMLSIALNEIRKLLHVGPMVAQKPTGFMRGFRAKPETKVAYTNEQKQQMILARSARTIVRTEVLELLRHKIRLEGRSDKLLLKQQRQLQGIKADEKWVWDHRENIEDWKAYARSHSAAQNSMGRAYYLTGNYRMAIKFLRWSIETHLPESFADPLINLAVVYLNAKRDRPIDWAAQARFILQDAVKISPSNTKAHYLLGRIYAAESEYTKAIKHYELAGDHSQTLYHHAKLLVNFSEKGRLQQALALLRRSIEYDKFVDERYVLYAQAALQAVEDDSIELQELKHVLRYAKRIVKDGATDELKKTGTQLVENLERAIKRNEPPVLDSNLFETLDRLLHQNKQHAMEHNKQLPNVGHQQSNLENN